MTREALDGDDLEARSGDGHNRAAGKEGTPARKGTSPQRRHPHPRAGTLTPEQTPSHLIRSDLNHPGGPNQWAVSERVQVVCGPGLHTPGDLIQQR
ncbi:hypothetical protein GCM10028793_21100 [Nocardiopsis oceani]